MATAKDIGIQEDSKWVGIVQTFRGRPVLRGEGIADGNEKAVGGNAGQWGKEDTGGE